MAPRKNEESIIRLTHKNMLKFYLTFIFYVVLYTSQVTGRSAVW